MDPSYTFDTNRKENVKKNALPRRFSYILRITIRFIRYTDILRLTSRYLSPRKLRINMKEQLNDGFVQGVGDTNIPDILVQGDPKLCLPLPGQNGTGPSKTDHITF